MVQGRSRVPRLLTINALALGILISVSGPRRIERLAGPYTSNPPSIEDTAAHPYVGSYRVPTEI